MHLLLATFAVLIASGLIVQAVTLAWAHPLAFIAFIVLGGSLVGLGVLLYLTDLIGFDAGSGTASSREPARPGDPD